MREILTSLEREYRRYKKLAEAAFAQATDAELSMVPSADGNSIASLAWHLSGNLKSRFTDFLSSDGEKPWRDRDSEFEARAVARRDLLAKWEEGWAVLFRTLSELDDDVLGRRVTIRGEEHTVLQALLRSAAHASYHVGQVVYLAKSFRGEAWRSLSIPRAKPPEPAVTVRNATGEDLDPIVRMLADDPLGASRETYANPLPASYRAAFDAIQADGNNELIVACLGGSVVGVLQITFIPCLTYRGGRRALVEGVRVDEAARGKGVGRALLLWAIGRARERGCHVVQLTTDKTRREAKAFYESLGFKDTHEGMKLPLGKEP